MGKYIQCHVKQNPAVSIKLLSKLFPGKVVFNKICCLIHVLLFKQVIVKSLQKHAYVILRDIYKL